MLKKRCSRCKSKKTIQEFHFKNKKRGWRHGICDVCMRAYRNAHYLAHRKETGRRTKIRNARIRIENTEMVRDYLTTHPCVDCGEDDLLVLEFDHVHGKKKNSISTMMRGSYRKETLIKEIKKCEVRCANCHRRVTIKRAKSARYLWTSCLGVRLPYPQHETQRRDCIRERLSRSG